MEKLRVGEYDRDIGAHFSHDGDEYRIEASRGTVEDVLRNAGLKLVPNPAGCPTHFITTRPVRCVGYVTECGDEGVRAATIFAPHGAKMVVHFGRHPIPADEALARARRVLGDDFVPSDTIVEDGIIFAPEQ